MYEWPLYQDLTSGISAILAQASCHTILPLKFFWDIYTAAVPPLYRAYDLHVAEDVTPYQPPSQHGGTCTHCGCTQMRLVAKLMTRRS